MTFFFLVVGLEAKREFDVGRAARAPAHWRSRCSRRSAAWRCPSRSTSRSTPAAPGAHGWGAAMSTDTAFALGALALLTPRAATRLRVFLLTLAVVDDLGALVVIATVVHEARLDARRCSSRSALFARAARAALRARVAAPGVGARRRRAVGRDVQVGHRSGDRRPRGGARDERLSPVARGPRARDRADALVSRAADAGARRARPSWACSRRSRSTSACSTSCTRGRATSSCRCSRSPTPAST